MQLDLTAFIVPAVGSSVALMAGVLVYLWKRRCDRHTRELQAMEPRIVITGTRGKSSTVRLMHAALREAGLRPYARVTGTVTEEIDPDGNRHLIRRPGQATVIEMLDTVQRATDARASTLVAECMAVVPELIALIQNVFVCGDLAVITNARADHLEEEGLDTLTTARTLAAVGVGALDVVTAEHVPEVRSAMEAVVAPTAHHVIDATAIELPAAVLAQLPDEHPDNIATVLAVTRTMGIPDEVAVAGMQAATHEPHDVEYAVLHRDGTDFTFVNLGSINDPESARDPLRTALADAPTDATRIALMVNRWDRPYRSVAFAAALSPQLFDAVLLTGVTTLPAWLALRRNGWPRRRIATLRWWDLRSRETLLRRLDRFHHRDHHVVTIALENIDNGFAQRMLHLLGGEEPTETAAVEIAATPQEPSTGADT